MRRARSGRKHDTVSGSPTLQLANPSVVAPRRTRVSSHRRSAPPLRDAAAAIMTKHRVGLPLSPLPPLTGPSEASVVAASPRSFGALLLLPRARARSLTRAWEVRSIQLRFLTAPRGFDALFTMVRVADWGASLSLRMTWHIRTDAPLTTSAARRPSSTRSVRNVVHSQGDSRSLHIIRSVCLPSRDARFDHEMGRSGRPWCAREACAAPRSPRSCNCRVRRCCSVDEMHSPNMRIRRAACGVLKTLCAPAAAADATAEVREDAPRGGKRWRRSSATVVRDAGRRDGRGRVAVHARAVDPLSSPARRPSR